MDKSQMIAAFAVLITILGIAVAFIRWLTVLAQKLEELYVWQRKQIDKYGDPSGVFDRLGRLEARDERFQVSEEKIKDDVQKLQVSQAKTETQMDMQKTIRDTLVSLHSRKAPS